MGVSQEFSQQMQFNVTPLGVVLMIVTLIPLGAAFSALLMTLSLFAKSYKEAQSYISPLMILVIVPAMYSMMPDTELSKSSAFIPVVNASMLMKGALMGTFDIGLFAMTMAVNLAFAGLCLYLVLRMFRRESVLFKI